MGREQNQRHIRDRWLWSVAWGLGFLLLMQAGSATGQPAEETEAVFWRSVECESARQVQVYLETYPNGIYVVEARACLEQQLGLDRRARQLVQQGLISLDYSVGAADGLFGPATRTALRQWQAGKGFAATGYLTWEQADTLIAQGREATAARRERDEEQPWRKKPQRWAREAPTGAQESPLRISPDQTCVGQSEGTECWMELANQAGCYVWNNHLQKDETVTWTDACFNSLAHGKGTVVWAYDDGRGVGTGSLQGGKWHGYTVLYQEESGEQWQVIEGPFVSGEARGQFVIHQGNGNVAEGPFVDDKPHGLWVIRGRDGAVSEGPLVDGKRHGRWTIRDADGDVREVTYVNGEQQSE